MYGVRKKMLIFNEVHYHHMLSKWWDTLKRETIQISGFSTYYILVLMQKYDHVTEQKSTTPRWKILRTWCGDDDHDMKVGWQHYVNMAIWNYHGAE